MPRRLTSMGLLLAMGDADAFAAVGGLLRKRGMSVSTQFDAAVENLSAADVATGSNYGGAGGGSPKFDVRTLPGICAPLGFFDPLDFCSGASEGKVRFYREVEIKHGRVAMLAALGFLVGERFHPLFGGDINVPSYVAFQATPLQALWPAVVLAISLPEIFSVFTFESPFGGEPWAIRTDYAEGDLGFDPLELKPKNPAELKAMQTKELNNGRLAMIAIAGMVGQELATGAKL